MKGPKRAAAPDALVILIAVPADDFCFFHLDAEVLCCKIDRALYREIGVSFAAAWSADLADGCQ